MSDNLPPCPECAQAFTYEMGPLLVCPMCGHEWSAEAAETEEPTETLLEFLDSVGNPLTDGDTVTIAKDLKVKGAGGGVLKVGTKVRGIRLLEDAADGHDIDATVPGFGRMKLKSSVVKKVL